MLLNLVRLSAFIIVLARVNARVTIKMVGYMEHTSFYCTNVQPSQCCKAISYGVFGGCFPFMFNTFLYAKFSNLPPASIAASFWPRFGLDENCNGRIKDSKYMAAGGNAILAHLDDLANQPSVTGAGYIKCGFPRKAEGWISVIAGLCVSFKNLWSRSWVSDTLAPRDDVPPFVYPDIITYNGMNYTDGGRGNLVYMSATGQELNLNPIGGTNPWTNQQCTALVEAQLYCWNDRDCKEQQKCKPATSADLNILMGAKVPEVKICVPA